jgi:hypothetical protein
VLGQEVDTAAVEAPCLPVVSSANGWKIVPVAKQMTSYLACVWVSARAALVRSHHKDVVIEGVVLLWSGW